MILVGDNPASKVYVKNKKKKASEVGIKSTVIKLSKNISEKELLRQIGLIWQNIVMINSNFMQMTYTKMPKQTLDFIL